MRRKWTGRGRTGRRRGDDDLGDDSGAGGSAGGTTSSSSTGSGGGGGGAIQVDAGPPPFPLGHVFIAGSRNAKVFEYDPKLGLVESFTDPAFGTVQPFPGQSYGLGPAGMAFDHSGYLVVGALDQFGRVAPRLGGVGAVRDGGGGRVVALRGVQAAEVIARRRQRRGFSLLREAGPPYVAGISLRH